VHSRLRVAVAFQSARGGLTDTVVLLTDTLLLECTAVAMT
jgi:hypothetical protein